MHSNRTNDSDDDNGTDNERVVEASADQSSFRQKRSCRNGIKCFYPSCKFDHPAGWNACEYGEGCRDFDCKANHPYARKRPCRNGHGCMPSGCRFLHPSD